MRIVSERSSPSGSGRSGGVTCPNSRLAAWRSAARSSSRTPPGAHALEAELLATYEGVPGSGGLPAASVFEPPNGGAFLVGRTDGDVVACGGIARYHDATAEIRRM
jgi:hypothetical protein